MSAEDYEVLRQHMLAEISAGTFHVSDLIGKTALDERVMTAMGKVPRHEFVPIELRLYAYANVPPPNEWTPVVGSESREVSDARTSTSVVDAAPAAGGSSG